MRDHDPEKPLISIHIPKCVGTRFNDVRVKWEIPQGARERFVHDSPGECAPYEYAVEPHRR